MLTREYVVRHVSGLWHVRCDGRLVSGQPTRMDALQVAEALAYVGALRGERARVLVGELDGSPVEFPTIEPRPKRA